MLELLAQLSDQVQASGRDAIIRTINTNKSWQRSSRVTTIQSFITNHMNSIAEDEHSWRLPKTSSPISYELHLASNIHTGNLAVQSEVSIKLKTDVRTDRLTLHSRSLVIEELKLFEAEEINEVPIDKYSLYTPTDMLTVYLPAEVDAGTEFVLNVKYRFNMNSAPFTTLYLSGLYRTSYVNEAGQTR